MFTETQLHFFREKIFAIESALFINQSDAILRLPNRIIRVCHIDDAGNVWFLVPRPLQHLTQFEPKFRVRLYFARKGAAWFARMEGQAHLVTDPEILGDLEDLPEWVREKAMKEALLIRVKASKVHFTPRKKAPAPTLSHSWSHSLQRLIQTQRIIFNQLRMKLHF